MANPYAQYASSGNPYAKFVEGGVPEEESGLLDTLLAIGKRVLPSVIPGGAAVKAGSLLDKGAYNLGGAVTDKASELGASPEVAGALGYASNVATQAAVPAVAQRVGAKLMSPVLREGAKSLMWSALKPDKFSRQSGKAERAVQTLLDEGANVTHGGVAKLNDKIDDLDDLLTQAINNSSFNGRKVDALKHIRRVLAEYRLAPNSPENLAAIRKVAEEFFDNPMLRGAEEIPVQLAQKMKRAYYKMLGDRSYGAQLRPAAERDATKAVAEGLKDIVEKGAPEAATLNAQLSPLINARNLAQARVLSSANKNPIGLGMIAANPKAMIPWLADRSELAKSLAARALYDGSELIPGTLSGLSGALYSYGVLGSPEDEKPLLYR